RCRGPGCDCQGRPGPALVLHGAVRDHRPERARRHPGLLPALRRPVRVHRARADGHRAVVRSPDRHPGSAAPPAAAGRWAGGAAPLARRAPDGARAAQAADGAGRLNGFPPIPIGFYRFPPVSTDFHAAARRSGGTIPWWHITMASKNKVIITCAVTGAIHTPSMSPHLPVTADEIAHAGIAAAEAGAAILHLHARDPKDGRPTQDPAYFRPFLERIKAATDAVINITTGGSPTMTVEDRMRPAMAFKPEVASLNMGSMNFGLFPMLNRFKEFQHDWEREYLENSRDLIFKTTYQDIETILRRGGENGTRFEFECYDISHLYNLAHFMDRGLVQSPPFIQSVFGILGGIGPNPEDLMHMRRTADR